MKSKQEDRKFLRKCAKAAGFRLEPLREDHRKSGVYFDLYKGKKNICCLYGGGKDPGFRIGEFLTINKNHPNYKEKLYGIYKACVKNLVSMVIMRREGNGILISFEIGIYRDGFNGKVLKIAVRDFEKSMVAVKKIVNKRKFKLVGGEAIECRNIQ